MEITVKLEKGIKRQEGYVKEVTVNEYSAGTMIDAIKKCERVVYDGAGQASITTSETELGFELLRRSITKVGDEEMQNGLTNAELRALSQTDLSILQTAVDQIAQASFNAVQKATQRGRDEVSS